MKDLTGTRLGQYEIVERLGGGGMAVVYRAVQQPLGREIALKALSSELFQDEGFVKRFETEAKTLAKLDHPNILPIYDFEVMDGNTFLTMPLIRDRPPALRRLGPHGGGLRDGQQPHSFCGQDQPHPARRAGCAAAKGAGQGPRPAAADGARAPGPDGPPAAAANIAARRSRRLAAGRGGHSRRRGGGAASPGHRVERTRS